MITRSGVLERSAEPRRAVFSLINERLLLRVILLVGLFHGLLYVFIVPPWQHYDEPTNFEYAWLIANHPGLPKPGDYDRTMQREVGLSLVQYGVFNSDFDVDAYPQNRPIWIGYPQLNDPPLYYMLVALPMRLFRPYDLIPQLYAGRLVSLGFLLITLLAAWGIAKEISAPGSALRWILPATLVMVPGFVDLMSAVNNDAAAVAIYSLFLWGSVRLIKRGFSLTGFLWVIGTAALCYFTKTTAYIALLLWPVVLILAILRGKWRGLAWGLLGIGVLFGSVAVFSWGDAATWYRSTDQLAPTRQATSRAVLGDYALQIQTRAQVSPVWNKALFQPVPPESTKELASKTLTLGAWMWASEPVETTTPVLNFGDHSYSRPVTLGVNPAWYALQIPSIDDPQRLWITLGPKLDPSGKDISIYFDGLVIVEGHRPVDSPPQFSDQGGNAGFWGGQPFTNLIRNGSAEISGPRVQPWIEKTIVAAFPSYNAPSFILAYLLDWSGANWHYWASGARLFRTFWAKFGWGNVPLLGHKPYRVLLEFTLLGILGATIGLYRRRKSLLWSVLLIMGVSLSGIWFGALIRGLSVFSAQRLWIPVARYAYPAVIPTLLVLSVGWLEVLRGVGRLVHLPEWGQIGLYFGLFFVLDVYSMVSIFTYFLNLLA
jgi:hypothetical protein